MGGLGRLTARLALTVENESVAFVTSRPSGRGVELLQLSTFCFVMGAPGCCLRAAERRLTGRALDFV